MGAQAGAELRAMHAITTAMYVMGRGTVRMEGMKCTVEDLRKGREQTMVQNQERKAARQGRQEMQDSKQAPAKAASLGSMTAVSLTTVCPGTGCVTMNLTA